MDWPQFIATLALAIVAFMAMGGLIHYGNATNTIPDTFKTIVTVVVSAFAGFLNQQPKASSTPAVINVTPAKDKLPKAKVGQDYQVTFNANGGTSAYKFSQSGSLPNGIIFDNIDTLKGTATSSGDFSFVILVTDSKKTTAFQEYVLHVDP